MLLTNNIEISLTNNIKYFEDLGYRIPRYKTKKGNLRVKNGTKLMISATDLPKGSDKRISYKCDKCGKIIITSYNNYINYKSEKDLCQKCSNGPSGILKRKSKDIFVIEAHKKHNNEYIYDKVKYENNKTKVIIRCPRHGDFTQTPGNHLRGRGCPECAKELQKSFTQEFTQKAQKVHGNKYIYDKVEYINNHTKVIIFCKKCKLNFIQTPNHHLRGIGCPICSFSKAELLITQLFNDNNILFKPQKTFKTCINPKTGHNFRYDFYLPFMNLLLEYDGNFHYYKVHKYHDLKKQKLHDRYKNMWAHKNGYNLIRISYKENIEKRLREAQII